MARSGNEYKMMWVDFLLKPTTSKSRIVLTTVICRFCILLICYVLFDMLIWYFPSRHLEEAC